MLYLWMSFEQRTEFWMKYFEDDDYTLAEGTWKRKDTSFIRVEIFLFFAHRIVCHPARCFCPM